jgi:DNA-binding MarR family transcriptional regulator
LSRPGEQLLRRAESAIAATEQDLLSPLDDQQREQLYAVLRRLADGVELCPAADHDACGE